MSRTALLLLSLIVLGMAFGNVSAQSGEDCSGILVAATISQYVADIRNAEESAQVSSLLEQLQGEIDTSIRNCRSSGAGLSSEGPGKGTRQDPYTFGVLGAGGDGVRIQVTGMIRPGNNAVARDSTWYWGPERGNEYVVVNLLLRCSENVNQCRTGSLYFRLTGDSGVIRDIAVTDTRDELEYSFDMFGGAEETGYVVFEVPLEEEDLKLVYSPYLSFTDDAVIFETAPPPGSGIEIASTTNINVRSLPGTTETVVGSLPPNTPTLAIGRNADGTWFQIATGWVFAELVSATGDIQSLPVTAQ